MDRRRITVLFGSLIFAAGLVRCVGDTPTNNPDAGTPDAAGGDTGTADAADAGSDSGSDAGDASKPPDAVGTLGWVRHYGTNYTLNNVTASSQNGAFIAVGGYQTPSGGVSIGGTNIPAPDGIDALVFKVDSQGNTLWARGVGGSGGGSEYFYSVKEDNAGALYLSGHATSGITLKNTLAGAVSYVAKLSGDGSAFAWDHGFTSNGGLASPYVAVAGGTVYTTFFYSGTLTYDNGKTFTATLDGSSKTTNDIAVIALNANDGSVVWADSLGGSANDTVIDVAIGAQGDPIVAGGFTSPSVSSTAGAGGGLPLARPGGSSDEGGFAIELDGKSGATKFAQAYGANGANVVVDAVAARGGKVVVGGSFSGAVDFGSGAAGSVGYTDGFVSVLDEGTQKLVLGRTLGGTNGDYVLGVAIDAWGELLATGYYASTDGVVHSTSGSKPLAANSFGTTGLLVAKWDPTGNLLWTKSVVPTKADGGAPYPVTDAGPYSYLDVEAMRVTVAASGATTVAGRMNYGADFGNGYQSRVSTMSKGGGGFCLPPFCGPTLYPDALLVNYAP